MTPEELLECIKEIYDNMVLVAMGGEDRFASNLEEEDDDEDADNDGTIAGTSRVDASSKMDTSRTEPKEKDTETPTTGEEKKLTEDEKIILGEDEDTEVEATDQ